MEPKTPVTGVAESSRERLLCSCGEDITPRNSRDEGWLFHVIAGHTVEVKVDTTAIIEPS